MSNERIDIVLEFLSGLNEANTVLDIGPSQNPEVLLKVPNAKKYAIDMNPIDLKGIIFKKCDLEKDSIPFSDGFFDYVICTEVIEHLSNADRLLSEIYRVLKKGGHLILSTPNSASSANRIRILIGRSPGCLHVSLEEHPWGHIRCYTLADLRYLLNKYNFTVKREKGAIPGNSSIIRKLIEPTASLSTYLVVLAEKS